MNISAETPYLAKFWFLNYWSKCSRLLKLHDPFKHNILESKGDEIDFLHANNVFCKLIVSFFFGCGWACLDMPKGHRIIKLELLRSGLLVFLIFWMQLDLRVCSFIPKVPKITSLQYLRKNLLDYFGFCVSLDLRMFT